MTMYGTLIRFFAKGDNGRKAEWILPHVEGRKVLDVGCVGEKSIPQHRDEWLHGKLERAASECIGIDRNEKEVRELQSQGHNIVLADAQNFQMDRKFDLVVACDVLEHLHDPKGFFDSVGKVLKEEGQLLITVPNPWFFGRFLRCFLKGSAGVNSDHVCWFCEQTLSEMLRRNGYEITRIELGSGETFCYRLFFMPKVLRHTSIWAIAVRA